MAKSAPAIKLNIKRKVVREGQNFWTPVGTISLWQDEQGKYSGKCQIFFWGMEFSVFEDSPKKKEGE